MSNHFLSRHEDGFSLTEGFIDPAKLAYEKYGQSGYRQRRAALASIVGTDQFLWAYEKSRAFKGYEMIKPVEWELKIEPARILGYIDDDKWIKFYLGESLTANGCFMRMRPLSIEVSVLLPFPILRNELVSRTIFQIGSPHKASIREKICFE